MLTSATRPAAALTPNCAPCCCAGTQGRWNLFVGHVLQSWGTFLPRSFTPGGSKRSPAQLQAPQTSWAWSVRASSRMWERG